MSTTAVSTRQATESTQTNVSLSQNQYKSNDERRIPMPSPRYWSRVGVDMA